MTDIPPTRRENRGAASSAEPGPRRATAAASPGLIDEIPLATMAAPPARRRPMIDSAPVFAPQPIERSPAGLSQGAVRVGAVTGRPSLDAAPAPIRPLEISGEVLPELAEKPEKVRSLWLHPAMLVSIATTLVALVVLAVLLVLGVFAPSSAANGLTLTVGDDNVRATWSGPDVPYQVVVVGGPSGEEVDVSQLVAGTEAWIPRAMGLIDERSCVVVRPASTSAEPVSLDAAALASQGGASACLAG